MSLLASLLLLIVAARLLGRLFAHFNQPELIGEILAGMLLGPALFDLIQPNPALAGIAELAVFLIILSAGLEMRFTDVVSAMRGRGMLLAVISFVVPFAAGVGVAAAFELDLMRKIFLGLCISITALPVAVKLLDNLGILHSRIARYALATAVVNDIAALFILGIVLNLPQQLSLVETIGTVLLATLKLAALASVVVAMNWTLEWLERKQLSVQSLPEKLGRYFGGEALFSFVIVFALGFGTAGEMLGFHFVIGAFFGALLLDKRYFLTSRYEDLRTTLASVTGGFLSPVFFAYLGLEFRNIELDEIAFPLTVIAVSVLAKVFSGWIGGRLIGMPNREALGLGCVLNGRGVMELVVAGIAYQKGFIGSTTFSTLVLMGIVTTLLTPILFKRIFPPVTLEAYRRADHR